jgi:chemosensory pili system protein ChpA (sensor histidine kinase/response regulator)
MIRFADDGRLDIAAIRRKAIERGLMNSVPTCRTTNSSVVFAGFSTADTVTQLSGRGVGMDVVHNEVKQLGGSITVDTRRGVGTTFIIRLPLTLSISQALMVRVSEQLFAIPLSSVVNILEVPVDQLNSIQMGRRPLLNWQDQVYPFMHLAVRLGIPPHPPAGRKCRCCWDAVAVARSPSGGRTRRHAQSRDQAIKGTAGIGAQWRDHLGDGSVVLIWMSPVWLTEGYAWCVTSILVEPVRWNPAFRRNRRARTRTRAPQRDCHGGGRFHHRAQGDAASSAQARHRCAACQGRGGCGRTIA